MKSANNAPYDFLIKMILVGDTGVGKTSFLLRFTEQLFDNASHIATIGKLNVILFNVTQELTLRSKISILMEKMSNYRFGTPQAKNDSER